MPVSAIVHWDLLDQLDPVAEGIAELKAPKSGNRNAILSCDSALCKPLSKALQVINFVGEVRFGCVSIDRLFRADVNLLSAALQPEPAAAAQAFRLGDFRQAKHAAVEGARFLLGAGRNGYLGVMKPKDAHVTGSMRTVIHRDRLPHHLAPLG